MKLATTSADFASFFADDKSRVKALYDAGFRYIDLSMYTANPDWIYLREDWEDKVLSLKEYAESLGMKFVQAHSPGGNPMGKAEDVEHLLKTTIRSIEICSLLGIENTVMHTGWRDDVKYTPEGEKVYYKENLEFLKKLFPVMEKTGVRVLIENSTHANMGDRYYFYKGEEMNRFLSFASHPLLGACWDTGHANCEGNQYDDILALGENLKAVHINDNRSGRDEHMSLYMGSVNPDEIINALIDIRFKGYFTLECDTILIQPGYWLGARKTFEKDTRLFRIPYELKLEAEKLLYKTGEYCLKAYNIFEE